MERFKKKQAASERDAKAENSRTVETQRMNVLSGAALVLTYPTESE